MSPLVEAAESVPGVLQPEPVDNHAGRAVP